MNAFLKKQNLKLPLPQNKRGVFANIWQKIVIGFIILILLIMLLNFFQSPIKNTFYVLVSPVLEVFLKTGGNTYNFFEPFLGANGLEQENNNLKQENQNLLSQIILLQETIKGDQAIKEVIQNTQDDNFKIVSAQTIGLDTSNDFLLIDKGFDDGISENMPVISSQKSLYGKVFKVYNNFSKIMLLSNKNSIIDAKIQNTDLTKQPILGAIKGNGNLSIYLDLVSSDAQIKDGDLLVTSGLEGIYPKDLLVGKIITKNKNDLKPFQTAEVQSFFDIKNIENLFIITNYMK